MTIWRTSNWGLAERRPCGCPLLNRSPVMSRGPIHTRMARCATLDSLFRLLHSRTMESGTVGSHSVNNNMMHTILSRSDHTLEQSYSVRHVKSWYMKWYIGSHDNIYDAHCRILFIVQCLIASDLDLKTRDRSSNRGRFDSKDQSSLHQKLSMVNLE